MRLNAEVGTRPSEERLAQAVFPDNDEEKPNDTSESSEVKQLRDYLGISGVTINAEIARQLGLPTDTKGVAVAVPGVGSGALAGLARRDVIVSVNYKPIADIADLVAQIALAKKNGRENVLLGVKRLGGPQQYVAVGIVG